MKTLLILRHAKSSWKDSELADHERPLNKRGRKAAPRMGRLIRDEDLIPDVILCSTAVRARRTAELAVAEFGPDRDVTFSESLYGAEPDAYLECLAALDDSVRSAMVIGHNPGLEELVESLTEECVVLPTAALALIELGIERWSDITTVNAGRLVSVRCPRDPDTDA